MKRVKWIVLILALVYTLGFFLWAPVSLAGIKFEFYSLTRIVNNYDRIAYRSWVIPLGEESTIFQLRRKNTRFWCNQFESCKTR